MNNSASLSPSLSSCLTSSVCAGSVSHAESSSSSSALYFLCHSAQECIRPDRSLHRLTSPHAHLYSLRCRLFCARHCTQARSALRSAHRVSYERFALVCEHRLAIRCFSAFKLFRNETARKPHPPNREIVSFREKFRNLRTAP